jgi:WD40 repeat protein
MLASCSDDSTIKKLTNEKLVSCSYDYYIIVYSKDNNNKYEEDYYIKSIAPCNCIIQTKENEICYNEKDCNIICFYGLLEQKIIKKVSNVNVTGFNSFYMITKDLLLVTGKEILTIINVNQYNLIRAIKVPDSSYIYVSCMLNKNTVLTGDANSIIKQWRIDGDNLILNSTERNAHKNAIWALIKLEDGLILSGSYDGEIRLWQYYL